MSYTLAGGLYFLVYEKETIKRKMRTAQGREERGDRPPISFKLKCTTPKYINFQHRRIYQRRFSLEKIALNLEKYLAT